MVLAPINHVNLDTVACDLRLNIESMSTIFILHFYVLCYYMFSSCALNLHFFIIHLFIVLGLFRLFICLGFGS